MLLKQQELEEDLKLAETAYKNNSTKANLKKVKTVRVELKSILHEKAER